MVGSDEIQRSMGADMTPQERVEDIFTRMDKDNNCKVTFDEFRQAVNQDPSLLMLMRHSSATAS